MFIHEVEAVEAVQAIHHGPKYIDHATQPAGQTFPYPDGCVDMLVISRVQGDNQLSFEQLAVILECVPLFWCLIF
ncbi:hypothetical protein ASPWEDRAFT_45210 [Aspergillus wentii DTO 134E9]|uniref:Uncharacterized protein n=1 Tax=Aspergillus wentii DTO 134E9 TaxID=1073089 RepID=A0A1L9R8J3_ASPWE|nr:uncharacterized protein ASPWEDRAFT_45210 [Aspergillus wentii DTO 134E9]OJJ31245.1 hypothetical protein ASPWEDRAFT_45210 [Aspergillus wentii DTO 134E9]